jgi:hypothetical protein
MKALIDCLSVVLLTAALLVALLLGTGIFAQGREGLDPDVLCSGVASIAADIARAHQGGVPLDKLLKGIGGLEGDARYKEGARQLAVSIYSMPRYSTPEYRANFVAKIRDRVHARCLREAQP